MTKDCHCNHCLSLKDNNNLDTNQDRASQARMLKVNTDKIQVLTDIALSSGKIPSKNSRKFTVSLSDTSDDNDFSMEFSREINISLFQELLSGLFGFGEPENDDSEAPFGLEDEVIIFQNFEEVINFLKNKNNKEE